MNSTTEVQKTRTTPKRRISHPVSGTATPLATAKAVTIHVELSLDTPRLPAIVGSETLAMVVSSTIMNVPSASAKAVSPSRAPDSGAGPEDGEAGAAAGAPGGWAAGWAISSIHHVRVPRRRPGASCGRRVA